MKRVIVTGATSQLGIFLLPRLINAGFDVLALSRSGPESPQQYGNNLAWVHPEHARTPVDAEFLVSCGPLEQSANLIDSQAGLDRVVAFSTSSLLTKINSSDEEERSKIGQIARDEKQLRQKCKNLGLPLLLLRPTLIYGCGMDRNISMLARIGNRFGLIPVAGSAAGLRQPVHADDLAALAVRALLGKHPADFESEACGGSSLSYRRMVQLVAESCDRRVRVLSLPEWVLAGVVRIMSTAGPYRGLNAEMVRRQGIDLVFDDALIREQLDYDPRPFEPCPGDFSVPEAAKQLQLSA